MSIEHFALRAIVEGHLESEKSTFVVVYVYYLSKRVNSLHAKRPHNKDASYQNREYGFQVQTALVDKTFASPYPTPGHLKILYPCYRPLLQGTPALSLDEWSAVY